jgi:hypothetical protein
MDCKPFFTYYGGKFRTTPRYPLPTHETLIEPFAGSAGYALRYPHLRVMLYDIDPAIYGVWSYLIRATEREILALPNTVADVRPLRIPDEAKWLIGFWLNKGSAYPRVTPSSWARKWDETKPGLFWGATVKNRIASQLKHIRHWRVFNESYESAENKPATWFIDPPYNSNAGWHYRCADIDYAALADWCRGRSGQVIVCEAAGADWLPFKPFRKIQARTKETGASYSSEVVWLRTCKRSQAPCQKGAKES